MKRIIIFLFTLIPLFIFAQDMEEIKRDSFKMPVLSVDKNRFNVSEMSFNRIVSGSNEEILEVEFVINNLTDAPMSLYVFVVATHESHFFTTSSFQRPSLEDRDAIKVITPFPEDIKNFEYTYKDEKGDEKTEYLKYPKNIKAGINPNTGEPYRLDERMIFRSYHPFRDIKKYKFFNEIIILIFDENEELQYKNFFKVNPKKR
ncbi:MAG: hypothetical protein WDA74_11525 [Spirochaetota bacterium]